MHPTHDELLGLVHGTLDEQTAESVAVHIEECSECEETVREFETAVDDVIQRLRTPATLGCFETEPGCRDLVSVVAAIGRDLSVSRSGDLIGEAIESDMGVIRDYRLLERIGEGGMGAVYKALHTRLQKVVALKVLPAARMDDPHAVQRFQREMQAVGRLSHPNIVGAHDAGEHEGTHFLVMEHVAGVDLSQLVRCIGPLPFADACELVRQAAIGLQHAHEHDLVHRDIKPSNLMLAPDGLVKILDLGLARLHTSGQQELTSTGQLMGTIDYIAPEQTGDCHDVDIRVDIFSLGATLYKLLTGVAPYSDPKYNTAVKKLAALANDPIPQIQSRREAVPAELAAVVSRMLAKNPDDRFHTPAEVTTALEPFTAGAEPAALLSRVRHSAPPQPDLPSDENSTEAHLSAFSDTNSNERQAMASAAEAFRNEPSARPSSPESRCTSEELNPTVIQPAPDNHRTTRFRQRTIVAALVIGIGILLGGIIQFRLKLPAGTIVLECDPAALKGAKIEVNGDEVTVNLTGDNAPATIGVDDRRGELRITKAGFKVFAKDFEIAVGEDEHSIKVRFEALVPPPADQTITADRRAAEWVLAVGGAIGFKKNGQRAQAAAVGDLPRGEFECELTRVDLEGNQNFSDAALAVFKGCNNITELRLQYTNVSDTGLIFFKDCKNLTVLHLEDTRVSRAGLAVFKGCNNLTELGLNGIKLSDASLAVFKDCKDIEVLHLSDTQVTDAGLAVFNDCKKLTQLYLSSAPVSDTGLAHFWDCENLRALGLNGAKLVSDAGLAGFRNCRNFTELLLADTQVTDAGLANFKGCQNLSTLSWEIRP